jgi:hypothetical protein
MDMSTLDDSCFNLALAYIILEKTELKKLFSSYKDMALSTRNAKDIPVNLKCGLQQIFNKYTTSGFATGIKFSIVATPVHDGICFGITILVEVDVNDLRKVSACTFACETSWERTFLHSPTCWIENQVRGPRT